MEAVTECQHQGRSLNATCAVKNQRNSREREHQRQQELISKNRMKAVLLMGDNEMEEASVYLELWN